MDFFHKNAKMMKELLVQRQFPYFQAAIMLHFEAIQLQANALEMLILIQRPDALDSQ